jgi:hypothetical protein
METPTDQRPPDAAAPEPRPWSALDPGVVALFAISLICAWMMPRLGALHGNDFKHLWLGSWLLAADRNPYDPAWLFRAARNFNLGAINPYVYLPTTGLLLRPLAGPFLLSALGVFS